MRILILLLIVLVSNFSFAQEPAQESEVQVSTAFGRPLNHQKVRSARSLDDIFAYFPHSWIESYKQVRVTVVSDGRTTHADGLSAKFTSGQVKLLEGAHIGDHVTVSVDFMGKNSTTNRSEPGSMKNEFTLMADRPAAFPQGNERFQEGVLRFAMDRILPSDIEKVYNAKVWFRIDESGKVADKKLVNSSGDAAIDRVLLEAIDRQPRWTPASDSKGSAFYRQEFALALVKKGC